MSRGQFHKKEMGLITRWVKFMVHSFILYVKANRQLLIHGSIHSSIYISVFVLMYIPSAEHQAI